MGQQSLGGVLVVVSRGVVIASISNYYSAIKKNVDRIRQSAYLFYCTLVVNVLGDRHVAKALYLTLHAEVICIIRFHFTS